MTARTLEEIEALAKDATPGPWTTKGKSVKAVGAPSTGTAPNGWQGGICNCMGSGHGPRSRIDELAESNAALIAALPDLLAIAQRQREEMAALKEAAISVLEGWAHDVIGPIPSGSCMCGCSKSSKGCDNHVYCDDGEYYAKGAIDRLEKAIGTKK